MFKTFAGLGSLVNLSLDVIFRYQLSLLNKHRCGTFSIVNESWCFFFSSSYFDVANPPRTLVDILEGRKSRESFRALIFSSFFFFY